MSVFPDRVASVSAFLCRVLHAVDRRWGIRDRKLLGARSAFGTLLAVASLFVPTLMMSREARADSPPKPQVYEVAPPEALGVLITEEVAPNVRQVNVVVAMPGGTRFGIVNVGYIDLTSWSERLSINAIDHADDIEGIAMFSPIGQLGFVSGSLFSATGTLVPRAETGIDPVLFSGLANFMSFGGAGAELTFGSIFGTTGASQQTLDDLKEWATGISFDDAELRLVGGDQDLQVALAIPLLVALIGALTAVTVVVLNQFFVRIRLEEIRQSCHTTTESYRAACQSSCLGGVCSSQTAPIGCCSSCLSCCRDQNIRDFFGCERNPTHTPFNATASCIVCE
jgi:hypothetical protein